MNMTEQPEESYTAQPVAPKKKGFFSRFSRGKREKGGRGGQGGGVISNEKQRSVQNAEKSDVVLNEKREQPPSPTPEETPPPSAPSSSSREESAGEAEEDFKFPSRAGRVNLPAGSVPKAGLPNRTNVVLTAPPSAREAAFRGPPRYDWIDIETAAAIKVQSAFRRNKVMNELEAQGMSTVAIRNRARRREAKKGIFGALGNADLFSCCGVALAFGADNSANESEATLELKKEQYLLRKKAQEEYEETVRNNFRKRHLINKRGDDVEEVLEVVE